MALIKCKECDKDVSEKAENCPNCGVAIKERKNQWPLAIASGVILFIIVAIMSD